MKKLPSKSSVLTALTAVLALSPLAANAQTNPGQTLAMEYSDRIQAVCDLFESRGREIGVNSAQIPAVFELLTNGEGPTVSPRNGV